ncbi:HPr kinase/phosphorylase [Listeria sp. FSL L7-0233]|uniref:HPr kinase/phosphorylase n=4 Tax=Listeria TaxID=1637 RepID=A0A7X1A2V4_9LIST|nr:MULTISPECIES: HPr(Ser) kinase/phosphatase [Listeria]EFR86744.1 HPr(Ser) kinase/phosphatase [Listeria marthii FSL S4-120]MBC1545086.1 HPr kinase/phosphorylase [Listeria cossartiae subsp. cossartiae]MBC1547421.1 HPr kinase/phosphorylase [Listeria cossartiae subsp. cossartiae]MBC1550710.1 HPr kinase/phosphorylase [Listeria cossartiae subsp. cossartiae]MBC1569620.1 HPr kinase/phosphorylase [Listeria cossartiae subsp. cossartiae]
MTKSVTVKDLKERLNLELICSETGLERPILTSDLSRPGLELTGFFSYYPEDRVQLFGMTEISFSEGMEPEERLKRYKQMCTKRTPAFVISRNLEVPKELVAAAKEADIPVLRSRLKTTRLSVYITNYLESRLAPVISMHGVLVDIYGLGVLITGSSGVGKSETALELVKRGHRLVADDNVEIRQEDEMTLIGSSPAIIEHLLEIRGLGIINVMTLFGAGAVRSSKKITIVVHLENWDPDKHYDRVGLDQEMTKIFDMDIPKITVPVRPGRNLSVIIEVAAMNFRLKNMGYNAAEQFTQDLNNLIGHNSSMND